ncbi:hypothetical protein GCM10009547_01160 [Sporichthya brevicatena]|uniref:Uncharacterized protein n=1 Tax=Sporichthya brevicatena TaxID=171442 RepID=A0ABP3RB20_9ACTN
MTRPTTAVLMIAALVIGGWVGWSAARRQVLNRAQVLALMGLQLGLVVQALASFISLAAGHDAAETSTHVVYALGSLLLLPLLVGVPVRLGFPASPGAPGADPQFVGGIEVKPPDGEGSADRFRAVVAALACVSLLVMLERMWVTWKSGS